VILLDISVIDLIRLYGYHQQSIKEFVMDLQRRASNKARLWVKNAHQQACFILDISIYRLNGLFRMPFNCKRGRPYFLKPLGSTNIEYSKDEMVSIIYDNLLGVHPPPNGYICLDTLGEPILRGPQNGSFSIGFSITSLQAISEETGYPLCLFLMAPNMPATKK
jgi:hypothetical protein